MVQACETKNAVNDEVAADGIGLAHDRHIDFGIARAAATLAQALAARLTEGKAAGDFGLHVRELAPDLVLHGAVPIDLPIVVVSIEDLRRRVEVVVGDARQTLSARQPRDCSAIRQTQGIEQVNAEKVLNDIVCRAVIRDGSR
jgi:hypothetical protein